MAPGARRLAELTARLSRCADLDAIVTHHRRRPGRSARVRALAADAARRDGRGSYTIASHGYPAEGVGSEAMVGEGIHRHGGVACARRSASATCARWPSTASPVRRELRGARGVRARARDPAAGPRRRREPASRCRCSRWASSSACSWSRADRTVAFTRGRRDRCSASLRRSSPTRSRPSGGATTATTATSAEPAA